MTELRFPGWVDGVNNVAKEQLLGLTELRKAENVDLDRGAHPARRKGYTKVFGDGRFSTLHAFAGSLYFVKDHALCVSSDMQSYDELDQGWHAPTFVELNSELIISDSDRTATITQAGDLVEFSAVGPGSQPQLAVADDGGLYAGWYQIAITYVNEFGHETGTKAAARIEVPEGRGIQLFAIPQPQDPSVTRIRIYASSVNGEVLFFRTSIPVGQTEYQLSYIQPKKRLQTQFLQPLPSSQHMLAYRGRLYVVGGAFLIFSEPFNYRLHDPVNNYVGFGSRIRGIAAVERGIYVAEENQISFVSGAKPDDFALNMVLRKPAQPGTLTTVDGRYLDQGLAGQKVACWWSEDGHFYFGSPDGTAVPVKPAEVAIPLYRQGVVKSVKRDGLDQLISLMKNPQRDSAFAAEDSVDVTVRRNGINLGEPT